MGCTNRAPPPSLTPKDGARFWRWDRDNLVQFYAGTSSQVGNPRRGFPTEKSPTGTFLALPALFSQERKVVGLCPTPCKLFVKSLTKNFSFSSTAPGAVNPPQNPGACGGIFLACGANRLC